ncbi:glycosyltransferase [Falsiroseomonas sp. CW058]|uniref:glycosyltransferase n=1 Tax=Falsiroseomonas sp. CW058 TaxID=3388664 RepID=UPI003D31F95A
MNARPRFCVLDMQVIDPPTGGGRQRLLGLFGALGGPTSYVGTWDWRGRPERRQMLTATLEEHLVPLSPAQFDAVDRESAGIAGGTVIDITFHRLGTLSPDYVAAARAAAAAADVVVFSHPWCWPLVADALRPEQLLVYDAHNVEGLLRVGLLDDGGRGTDLAREVVRLELAMCRAADLVLACSVEDAEGFAALYGIDAAKIRIAANGAFADAVAPAPAGERDALRAQLGLDGTTAFFIGSDYGPNADAARFIADRLAPALPAMRFVVAGGVGASLGGRNLPANVTVTGTIEEAAKRDWLRAADIAVNPMFGGSGTNVKMLDYFAAGLPVVTTATGARGLRGAAGAMRLAESLGFAAALRGLAADAPLREAMSAAARRAVERHYAWERLSPAAGRLLARHGAAKGRDAPFFSVVVPTFRRHAHLDRLVARLARQDCRDFEVVVVDQSEEPWAGAGRDHGVPLHYLHTDLRGAVAARNTGADLARGAVIAFTDDDCEPHPGWLEGARAAFDDPDVVGVEGLILSDKVGDPDWRWVTNDGFEGIGFMTANLFVRAAAFHRLGGFDPDFEEPHFREDTDLGWRLQAIGLVPFSREAWVFHPPHPRREERESLEARSRFFEKDALLLRKHPGRYPDLLRREAQWTHNPHFRAHLLRGAERYGVTVPEDLLALMG